MNKFSEVRKSKGLSQQAVADFLGVSRQAYCNYESEKREASYEVLLQLSELFECSIDELFGRGEEAAASVASPEAIKFALFGGDTEVTDEMYEEVLRYAEYIKNRKANQ